MGLFRFCETKTLKLPDRNFAPAANNPLSELFGFFGPRIEIGLTEVMTLMLKFQPFCNIGPKESSKTPNST